MAVLRIHKKQNNFVILDKTCLKDKDLSWGAKGLHSYLISLPDDWEVRVEDLQKKAKNGRDAVRGLLKELEQAGYIQKSLCRQEESGRFEGIEYLVLEVPESKNASTPAGLEELYTAPPETENPAPGNPSPVNPAPEKATLISNKYNNNYINKITAADNEEELRGSSEERKEKAAAVSNPQKQKAKSTSQSNQPSKIVQFLAKEDASISHALTENQLHKIQEVIEKLNIGDTKGLIKEIQFSMLSKKHFTGCGTDFSKKLNAIRSVIVRGDWQTPVDMLVQKQKEPDSELQKLEQDLRNAEAEIMHFKRLLASAKEQSRSGLEKIIEDVQMKITDIQGRILQEGISQQLAMN